MKQSTHNLRIVFFRKSGSYANGGSLCGFEVSGHAGYGEEGNDIVCSAVSSAVMLVCNTITDFFHADADVSVGENDIVLRLNNSDVSSERLLESFLVHAQGISEDYPGVRVEIRDIGSRK